MYKVLIIDDEEPVREAIEILGEWDKIQVDEVLEAHDGLEGMRIVREIKPDIVIVDMKMPLMNGVEFLKIIQAEYPDIQTIVVSGYDSFEFTRQAILSKAVDYILKPINKKELNEALLSCAQAISKKKQESMDADSSTLLNLSLSVLKAKILTSIIEGNSTAEDKEMYLNTFDIDGDRKEYAAAILRIVDIDSVADGKNVSSTEQICEGVVDFINGCTFEDMECFAFTYFNSSCQIILAVSNKNALISADTCRYVDTIKRLFLKVKDKFGLKAVVCICEKYSGIESLDKGYAASESILNSINVMEIKDEIYTQKIEGSKNLSRSVFNNLGLIKNAFEKGSFNYLKSIIDQYLGNIRSEGYFSLKDAEKTLKEFIILMGDISSGFGTPDNLLYDRYRGYGFITFDVFEKVIYDIISFCYHEVRKCIKANEVFNVSEIKDYIDKNYSQEIKISMFTERYYLSREYIMKLFKREFGCGIHEYVQDVRMEKAKELLSDMQIKIQNISQILGYSDTNYFSKAFKNYYGISPTDYRFGSRDV